MHANYMLPVAENRKVCHPIKNQGGHLCIRNNMKSTHMTSSMSSIFFLQIFFEIQAAVE